MKFNLFKKNKDQYTLYSLLNRKWAYISYIPEVYYHKKDKVYMRTHQNKREALIIGEIMLKSHAAMPPKSVTTVTMILFLV